MHRKYVVTGIAAAALCVGAAAAQAGSDQMLQAVSSPMVNSAPATAYEGQVKDDLLEGLDRLGTNAKEKNEVNLDKNMLALAGGKKGGRYADLAQKMDFITIRNYEFASKGLYQRGDLDALRHRLEGDGWSHVVRNESDGETNDIVVRADREGFINDMVVLNAEPKEVNIVHLRGRFRMEDVQSAMGSAMGLVAGTSGMAGAMGHATGSQPMAPTPPAPPAAATDPTLKKR